jgi:hypothetical protein
MSIPSGEIKSLGSNAGVMPVQRFPCRKGKHAFTGGGVFM